MPDLELQQLTAMLQAGAYEDLEQRLARRVQRQPMDAQARRLCSMLASARGRMPMALEQMSLACELAPEVPEFRYQMGCLLAHAGRYADAIESFEATVAISPEMADAWYFLGLSLLRMHNHLDALQALRQACRLAPDVLKSLEAVAELEFRIGFPADALPLWIRLSNMRPDDLHTTLKRGECESRTGRFDEARRTYRAALQAHPQIAELWMALAQAEEDSGDREGAAGAYQRALSLRPGWAEPFAGLLALQRGGASPQLLHAGASLMDSASADHGDRALIGYALGRAYDALGRYDEAWRCWTLANQARQRTTGAAGASSLPDQVQRVIEEFGHSRGVLHASSENTDDRFVFIVGMPRSGTTLMEQIVDAHPLAHACGERPDIALIVRHLPLRPAAGMPPWPRMAAMLTQADLQAACTRYAEPVVMQAPPEAVRLLDKEPLNFQHLGLIEMMYPGARIIWCRRDPRDVAVSIYGENFAAAETLATSLDGIGQYINLQERLMRHWVSTLRLPILEVQYEALVTDVDGQARRIVEFLGLPWDDACLKFHTSAKGVQTPSRWQVKQPVHARSVGRWRNYQTHLGPLLATLDPGRVDPSVSPQREF